MKFFVFNLLFTLVFNGFFLSRKTRADFIPIVHAGEKLDLKKSRSIIKKIEEASEEWEHIYTKDSIKISTKRTPNSTILAVKGETIYKHDISKVATVLIDHKRSKEWVDKLENSYPLKQIHSTARVIYTHMDAPWPVQDRDFITYQEISADPEKGTLVFIGNTITDVEGPNTDNVRGTVTATGILKASEDGKSTSILMEVQGDPKGRIPSFIVNFIQEEWPYESLSAMKKQLEKEDVHPHTGILNFMKGLSSELNVFPLYPAQNLSKQ